MIVVTGGTGTLGRKVVGALLDRGERVRVLSRRGGAPPGATGIAADLREDSLGDALRGARAVVHCASTPTGGDRKAADNLLAAGAPHLVYVSIVGVDRIPLGYYRTKLAVERRLETAGVPYTILRATQFHDLVRGLTRGAARLPVVPAPSGIRVQPVDSGEVADRLAELALGDPAGRVPDLGGPEVHELADLMRACLRADGRRRPVWRIRLAGRIYRAYRAGYNLVPDGDRGAITFQEFLARS
ncbi:SDR family oxidoreductase [Amycolatopsis suaedae]|uniref:SDR family oxidoreductase n=1 Tax=Amycolatopsis suaedae TaxID=2510978 RepID=A0A4Q7IZK4_9PSEU|nr:SDR family oxidoreductase [Amycolatopsis suaedae]RZQ59929.1 SDR family oxidoreductase [Amycolatopsis suaedae]